MRVEEKKFVFNCGLTRGGDKAKGRLGGAASVAEGRVSCPRGLSSFEWWVVVKIDRVDYNKGLGDTQATHQPTQPKPWRVVCAEWRQAPVSASQR
jgi:hypothetical protein